MVDAPMADAPITAETVAPAADQTGPTALPEVIRWVALGAADGPWSNQLSIEDELLAVAARLGAGGVTLYAGGAGSTGVQVADAAPRGSTLMQTLGAILDPRAGRDAHYQALRVRPHDVSSYDALERVLQKAVAAPGTTMPPRLTVWIAGHGAGADAAKDVAVPVWFGDALLPEDLARALTGPRPFRLVQTTCFSGAFAELVIDQPNRACGAFATRWNLEASGCDPSAAARDSYGAMLLGEGATDLDGDGALGLSERHVHAATAGPGIEVPLLSSEVWLEREIGEVPADATPDDKLAEPLLAEERALFAGLLARSKLTAAELPARFDALADAETAALTEQATAAQELEALRLALVSELVSRWPAIEDPWHPDFAATLANEGAAIEAWLGANATRWRAALAANDALDDKVHALELELAVLDRAMVARDTMLRAAVARAGVEGSTWATFAALRACEREALP